MSETRIEVIAIGNNRVYSVSSIVVSRQGDVYVNSRIKDSDFHTSRHASGKTHWKSTTEKIYENIRTGKPIKDFDGIESLGMQGFGIDSLPELYKEYKIEQYDGIFCLDMRQYQGKAFNMFVYMLTENGLTSLLSSSNLLENRQICIFPECRPMIAIIVGSAKQAIAAKT